MAVRRADRRATGARDRVVLIQGRPAVDVVDGAGFPSDEAQWTTLSAHERMSRHDLSAAERFTANQQASSASTIWNMTYRADMDPELLDVPKLRRLRSEGRYYDITAAAVVGAKDSIDLETLGEDRLMGVTMKFEGGAELAALLQDLPTRVQKGVLLEALSAGGEPIRATMARLAPRSEEPPHVGDHIVIGTKRERGTGASVAIGPSRDFEERANVYPVMQEVGTAHHEPQPYARPAFDANQANTLGIIRQQIWFELLKRGIGSARTSGGGGLV